MIVAFGVQEAEEEEAEAEAEEALVVASVEVVALHADEAFKVIV